MFHSCLPFSKQPKFMTITECSLVQGARHVTSTAQCQFVPKRVHCIDELQYNRRRQQKDGFQQQSSSSTAAEESARVESSQLLLLSCSFFRIQELSNDYQSRHRYISGLYRHCYGTLLQYIYSCDRICIICIIPKAVTEKKAYTFRKSEVTVPSVLLYFIVEVYTCVYILA